MKNWRLFVKAGRATFTLENVMTGGRFTYKVTKSTQVVDLWFVSVLGGPNNEADYLYIGAIKGTAFALTPRSRGTADALSFKAFAWLNEQLNRPDRDLPEHIKIRHSSTCGRCGRTLTVPESIEWGFGPECIITVLGGAPSNHHLLETAKTIRRLMQLQARAKKEETNGLDRRDDAGSPVLRQDGLLEDQRGRTNWA